MAPDCLVHPQITALYTQIAQQLFLELLDGPQFERIRDQNIWSPKSIQRLEYVHKNNLLNCF